MNWINKIEFKDLFIEAPFLMLLEDKKHGDDINADTIAKYMVQGGPIILASGTPYKAPKKDTRPSKSLWESVKKEMLRFICGDDSEYEKLRKELDSLKNNSAQVIIPAIAAYLAHIIGVEAGAITGLISLLIGVLIKIGKNGFCNYYYNQ